jgi:hypothetical protein
MPEFDTYHVLERFARDNANSEARQAYLFLRRRTELSIQWRALGMAEYAPMKKLTDLYMGVKDTMEKVEKLEDMTEEARQKLFAQACAQTGVQIDPELFTKNN